MDIEELVEQFDGGPNALSDAFFAWYDEALGCPSGPDTAEFRQWWHQLSEQAGGTMPTSVQIDVRAVFGEIASAVDRSGPLTGQDGSGYATTTCRDRLVDAGLSPTGLWKAELLLDRCTALIGEERRTVDYLLGTHVGGERNRGQDACRSLIEEAVALIGSTSSIPARRAAHAVAAWCAHWLGDDHLVREHAGQFFEFDRQATRESGSYSSEDELAIVAAAVVSTSARSGDRAGLDEAMRKVRLRVEDEGRLGPFFSGVWARGLAEMDPHFAQLIAHRLVLDVEDAGLKDSDVGYWSAFLLFEMLMAAGDVEPANLLASEWMPRAMHADYGPGAQSWIEMITLEGEASE